MTLGQRASISARCCSARPRTKSAMPRPAAPRPATGPNDSNRAIGQPGLDAGHVVHHVAVGDASDAAGVVAGHAAERGLRAGGHIDREPQAVRLEPALRGSSTMPGSTSTVIASWSKPSMLRNMLAGVDHQRRAHVWPHWRGAAAARQRGHAQVAAMSIAAARRRAARHEHAHRHDLVDRRVGGVAAARRQRTAPRLAFPAPAGGPAGQPLRCRLWRRSRRPFGQPVATHSGAGAHSCGGVQLWHSCSGACRFPAVQRQDRGCRRADRADRAARE